MNVYNPVTVEDKSAELTSLHEKFTFIPEDLEMFKTTDVFKKRRKEHIEREES